jgi:hypothetical protein
MKGLRGAVTSGLNQRQPAVAEGIGAHEVTWAQVVNPLFDGLVDGARASLLCLRPDRAGGVATAREDLLLQITYGDTRRPAVSRLRAAAEKSTNRQNKTFMVAPFEQKTIAPGK